MDVERYRAEVGTLFFYFDAGNEGHGDTFVVELLRSHANIR